MKVFHCDLLSFPLPAEQDFLVDKYRMLAAALSRRGRRLVDAPAASLEELARIHHREYLTRLLRGEFSAEELRAVGLPWSPAIVERARRTAGATVAACRAALSEGVAVHLGGGTHHAFADRPRGFCWLNDVAVAAEAMRAEKRVQRVLILDCDVHQGDGTAAIFRGRNEVFTLSIHGGYGYPYRKEPSDLDVDLPEGTGDEEYLDTLSDALDAALKRFVPELVIYLAGADVYRDDRFGRFDLSAEGIARRDRMVMKRFMDAGTSVAVTLAGGYARRIEEAVEIHLATVEICGHFHGCGAAV